MDKFQTHHHVALQDVLAMLIEMKEEGVDPKAKEVTERLVDTDEPVDSNHQAYRKVNGFLNDAVEEGLASRERFGRSYVYGLTDAGETVGSKPVEGTVAVETADEDSDESVAEHVESIQSEDIEAQLPDQIDLPDARPRPEDLVDTSPLDEVIDDDTPDLSEIDYSGSSVQGKRSVEDPELRDKKVEAPTHWPPEHPEQGTRQINAVLTNGPNCEGSRIIVSEDAVEAGLVDSLDHVGDSAFRMECPHCGRTCAGDVTADGQAKLKTHVVLQGTARPRKERFIWVGNDEDGSWELR